MSEVTRVGNQRKHRWEKLNGRKLTKTPADQDIIETLWRDVSPKDFTAEGKKAHKILPSLARKGVYSQRVHDFIYEKGIGAKEQDKRQKNTYFNSFLCYFL